MMTASPATLRRDTRKNLWIGAALLGLLIATILAAHLVSGPLSPVIALAIAIVRAGLVALFFMDLARGSPQTRVFAAAALVWLGVIFTLTLTDYLARPTKARAPYSVPDSLSVQD